MKKINDGWHKLNDYEVYVEDGFVTHGTKMDINRSPVPSYPYRWDEEYNAWIRQDKVKFSTFRNGVKKGNWKLS